MHAPVRLIAIDVDGTLIPGVGQPVSARTGRALVAAQQAGIIVAIATGRRTAYTAPLLDPFKLRADTPLITSNGAVLRTLGGESLDCCHMPSAVARGLCSLLRPFGCLVFTFDRAGRGELVLEDMSTAEGRIALWIEANRNAIEVINPLESAFSSDDDPASRPIQGMAAGTLGQMREAEQLLRSSSLADQCDSVRTEYPARDLSILDLLPKGVSKGWALARLAARLGVAQREVMAIGDNWNDRDMLEWAGHPVLMGNAAAELRSLGHINGWKLAPPNDQDGVAQVLERTLLQQKSRPATLA